MLAVHRTRIFIGFFGSIERLFALAVFVFLLLKWAAHRAFSEKDGPHRDPPTLPGAQ